MAEKLVKVARSRFSVKLPEQKLKEKLDKHLIPENYTASPSTKFRNSGKRKLG